MSILLSNIFNSYSSIYSALLERFANYFPSLVVATNTSVPIILNPTINPTLSSELQRTERTYLINPQFQSFEFLLKTQILTQNWKMVIVANLNNEVSTNNVQVKFNESINPSNNFNRTLNHYSTLANPFYIFIGINSRWYDINLPNKIASNNPNNLTNEQIIDNDFNFQIINQFTVDNSSVINDVLIFRNISYEPDVTTLANNNLIAYCKNGALTIKGVHPLTGKVYLSQPQAEFPEYNAN